MERDILKLELENMQFDITRSQIYYEHRMFFWNFIVISTQVLELSLSSIAFVSMLQGWPCAVKIITGIAAILGVFVLVFKAADRSKACLEQRNAFSDLLKLFPVDLNDGTEELLKTVRDTRIDLEKKDDVLLKCLDVICHNEACTVFGREGHKFRLGPIEQTIGKYFPMHYTPKPVNEWLER